MAFWFAAPPLLLLLAWIAYTDNPVAQEFETMFHRAHAESIGSDEFSVGAASFTYFKFEIPAAATDVAIRGQFLVQGPGGDISVQLLTDNGFVSWQNGYSASGYYNSGQVTQGTINAALPSAAGTYYLVFSNRSSPKNPKTVDSAVTLTYRRWWPIF